MNTTVAHDIGSTSSVPAVGAAVVSGRTGRLAVLCATVGISTALVIAVPRAWTAAIWFASLAWIALRYSGLEDDYDVQTDHASPTIRHRNWLHSVAVRTDEIVAVEHGTPDGPSRDVLLVDRHGRSVSVRQSVLRSNEELAAAVRYAADDLTRAA